MKLVPLFWGSRLLPTFVLRKAEVDVLLDLTSKNPRSWWWGLDFGTARIYACDGYRILSAETGQIADAEGQVYLASTTMKAAMSKATLDHAFLIAFDPEVGQVWVARVRKAAGRSWDTEKGDPIAGEGDTLDYEAGADAFPELTEAVPRISSMEGLIPDFHKSPGERTAPIRVALTCESIATFGKLTKVGVDAIAVLWPGAGSYDATIWTVDTDTREARWFYVLMPVARDQCGPPHPFGIG